MRMSLVFAGSHVAFHHQYFKIVDMLIHHFEKHMHGLNLRAKPYAHRKEEDKINRKEDNQQNHKRANKLMEECDFGWKIPSKSIFKRNAKAGTSTKKTACSTNSDRHSIFEAAKEDEEEEDFAIII